MSSQKSIHGCRYDVSLEKEEEAVVYPFAKLPEIAKERKSVNIIEINAEPTPLTEENISDFLIQGKTGDVLPKTPEEVKKNR